MRVGQNPAKSIEHVPQPEKVTVAVVSYIPFLSGYYASSLDVLKACLDSIRKNTGEAFDVLVFDNASCSEVRDYLTGEQNQGRIQYLVLSDKNIGKGGAWNFIFAAAPGDYIAYSDSDVYFKPGWLSHSLELLSTFPNVGMITGRPMRTPERHYTTTLDWANHTPGVSLEKGRFQTWEMYKEHNDSLGVSVEQTKEWFESSRDVRITYQGLSAYVGAAHFQFVGPKSVLKSMVPLQMDRPMGQVRSLDEKLNQAGYLRLSTCQPLVRHLGNRLDLKLEDRVSDGPRTTARNEHFIFNLPPVKRSLLWLYDRIFRLYF